MGSTNTAAGNKGFLPQNHTVIFSQEIHFYINEIKILEYFTDTTRGLRSCIEHRKGSYPLPPA
jgi:hypothetical protein